MPSANRLLHAVLKLAPCSFSEGGILWHFARGTQIPCTFETLASPEIRIAFRSSPLDQPECDERELDRHWYTAQCSDSVSQRLPYVSEVKFVPVLVPDVLSHVALIPVSSSACPDSATLRFKSSKEHQPTHDHLSIRCVTCNRIWIVFYRLHPNYVSEMFCPRPYLLTPM